MLPGAVTAPENHREGISGNEQGEQRAGRDPRGQDLGEQGREEDPQGGNARLGNAGEKGGDGGQHPFRLRERKFRASWMPSARFEGRGPLFSWRTHCVSSREVCTRRQFP